MKITMVLLHSFNRVIHCLLSMRHDRDSFSKKPARPSKPRQPPAPPSSPLALLMMMQGAQIQVRVACQTGTTMGRNAVRTAAITREKLTVARVGVAGVATTQVEVAAPTTTTTSHRPAPGSNSSTHNSGHRTHHGPPGHHQIGQPPHAHTPLHLGPDHHLLVSPVFWVVAHSKPMQPMCTLLRVMLLLTSRRPCTP